VQVVGKDHSSALDAEKDTVTNEAVAALAVSDLDDMKKGLSLFPAMHKSPPAPTLG
jgi:hypothetical protein